MKIEAMFLLVMEKFHEKNEKARAAMLEQKSKDLQQDNGLASACGQDRGPSKRPSKGTKASW